MELEASMAAKGDKANRAKPAKKTVTDASEAESSAAQPAADGNKKPPGKSEKSPAPAKSQSKAKVKPKSAAPAAKQVAKPKPRGKAKAKPKGKAKAKPTRKGKAKTQPEAKAKPVLGPLAKAPLPGAPIVRPPVKRKPLPGPKIKRAPKKSTRRATTKEKLAKAEKQPVRSGKRPLDGIRVLDLSRLLPGPYASHILASFGADVIKVEKPGEGDYMREYMPQLQGMGATFFTINRGKQSIAIDLSKDGGKEVFLALVKRADVVLDGFRPGVMDRLGLGFEELRKTNPRLIYAALTGFGQTGPYADRAGHDLNYMALSGMLELLSDSSGVPLLPGVQLADVAAGALPAVIGILLAIQHRHKKRIGQMVDISMFDALLGMMPAQVANYSATKLRPKRGHERLFGRYACYNIYPVRNGRYISVAALEPKFWADLCNAIERPDLIADQYAEGHAQEVLKAELTRTFQKKQAEDWMEVFAESDACVCEVREIPRAVQDPAATRRGMITPVRGKDGEIYEQVGVFPKLSEAPGYVSGEAPRRGEHTRDILRRMKYTVKRIEALLEEGAIEEHGRPYVESPPPQDGT